MIEGYPLIVQYIIWVISAMVAVYGLNYWQIVQLRRMPKDKQPDYYRNDTTYFNKSSWGLSHFYCAISAIILFGVKPRQSDISILLAMYIGFSVPNLFEKNSNWLRKQLENNLKGPTISD